MPGSMMRAGRSSMPWNRKSHSSARSIPPAGSYTASSANRRIELRKSPTDFPDEPMFESVSFEDLNDFIVHLKKLGLDANTVLHNVIIIAQFFKRNGRSGIM